MWLKNGRNAPMLGSFHFFFTIVNFGSLCLYVKFRLVFLKF